MNTTMDTRMDATKLTGISASCLYEFLTQPTLQILMVDCRSFIEFNQGHITGASNIHCPPIVKRRSGGSLSLANIITCQESRDKLLAGFYDMVMCYDDEQSENVAELSEKSTTFMVVRSLLSDAVDTLFYLEGGYKNFSSRFPQFCRENSSPSCTLRLSSPVRQSMTSSVQAAQIMPWLYLGNNIHAADKQTMLSLGITSLLNVSKTCVNHFEDVFRYMTISVDDNSTADISPWFHDAIQFIEATRRMKGKVLVHCHAGVSRSATICIAYVMYKMKLNMEDSYAYVKSRRGVIAPNLNFMRQLTEFEADLRTLECVALPSPTCAAVVGTAAYVRGEVFSFPSSPACIRDQFFQYSIPSPLLSPS